MEPLTRVIAVLLLLYLARCKAGTLTLSSGKISIKGHAQMKFTAPEKMWAGLSAGTNLFCRVDSQELSL